MMIWGLSKYSGTNLQITCFYLFHLLSLPHFLRDFWRTIFLLLYYINWPNFIFRLPLIREILSNMCIVIAALANQVSQLSLSFQSKRFFSTLPKSQDKNLNILRTKRQGGHYSWKFRKTPGNSWNAIWLLEKLLENWKTHGKLMAKRSLMCVLPKCSSFINAKSPYTVIKSSNVIKFGNVIKLT